MQNGGALDPDNMRHILAHLLHSCTITLMGLALHPVPKFDLFHISKIGWSPIAPNLPPLFHRIHCTTVR